LHLVQTWHPLQAWNCGIVTIADQVWDSSLHQ